MGASLLKRIGVGTQIVLDVIENAKEEGFKYLVLTCEVDNYAAQRLYRKCGFQLLGEKSS